MLPLDLPACFYADCGGKSVAAWEGCWLEQRKKPVPIGFWLQLGNTLKGWVKPLSRAWLVWLMLGMLISSCGHVSGRLEGWWLRNLQLVTKKLLQNVR